MSTLLSPRPSPLAPPAAGGGIVADPWLRSAVVVPGDRCGSLGFGDAGWVAGMVAGHLGRGPVEVTLHAPVPVDVPLELRAADDRASLSLPHGPADLLPGRAGGVGGTGRPLVSARRVGVRLRAPAPVTWDEARAAEDRFAGDGGDHAGHGDGGASRCYVCGTGRAPGDGLRRFAGPVPGRPAMVAATCVPLPDRSGPAGAWALLGCPAAWAAATPGQPVRRLGGLTGQVLGPVRPGERHLVVAERAVDEGRRVHVRVAAYPAAPADPTRSAGPVQPVAVGLATWDRVS